MPDAPYTLATHEREDGAFALEFAPREGQWTPVFAAIPFDDHVEVIRLGWGVPGDPDSIGGVRLDVLIGPKQFANATGDGATGDPAGDDVWWDFHQVGGPPATPERHYFLVTARRPSRVRFGTWSEHWVWPDGLDAPA